jgi:hypothetical protein
LARGLERHPDRLNAKRALGRVAEVAQEGAGTRRRIHPEQRAANGRPGVAIDHEDLPRGFERHAVRVNAQQALGGVAKVAQEGAGACRRIHPEQRAERARPGVDIGHEDLP